MVNEFDKEMLLNGFTVLIVAAFVQITSNKVATAYEAAGWLMLATLIKYAIIGFIDFYMSAKNEVLNVKITQKEEDSYRCAFCKNSCLPCYRTACKMIQGNYPTSDGKRL